MRRWRIAMVSEHASPLAMLGGVDAGGQNIHVAELAGALARRGHAVRVYTRRDDPDIAPVVPFGPGVDVEHVPAGPPTPLPKDELLPYMGEFGRYLAARWEADFTPAVVHAHFWMSGLAALTATAIQLCACTTAGVKSASQRAARYRPNSPMYGSSSSLGSGVGGPAGTCSTSTPGPNGTTGAMSGSSRRV